MDGTLTRCELDPVTAKLIDRVELSCGGAPCQTIAGDGDTLCYIQSGKDCWRCELWDGVVKMVPWRFPSRQTAFVPFILPPKQQQPIKNEKLDKEVQDEEAGGGSIVKDEEGNQFMLIDGNNGGDAASGGGEHVIAVRNRELSLFIAQKTGGSGGRGMEYSMSTHPLPLEGRRILQHPTRPSYFIIASTEHRSHGMKAVERSRREAAADPNAYGIPLDAPQRALGLKDHYNSSLQLFVKDSNHVFPPYYLPEGDGISSVAVGSFQADFGREPVVVVGAASQYTHGAGCGKAPSWTQGWLRAFRFTSYAATPAGGTHGNTSGASAPQRTVMMDSEGNPILRLEPLHNTLIRTTPSGELSHEGALNHLGASLNSALGAPDYPSAVHICEDVGLLLVGLGPQNGLRIYVWGQQQFLRKRQLPNFPSRIVAIETMFFTPPSNRGVNAGEAVDKSALSKYFLPDLYHCPFDRPEARRQAMEKQLLVICATMSHSVIVAALQPGSAAGTPSFLMVVAQDAVPRSLTALAVFQDDHTLAVADRFGHVVLLRLSDTTRTRFALPMEQMSDLELDAVGRFIAKEQDLQEVACHHAGEIITGLQVRPYNPSQGADPSLAIDILFYATAMGRVGAYVPFVSEEDAAMAAYVQPVLTAHLRALLAPGAGRLPYDHRTNAPRVGAVRGSPTHHIIDGDLLALYRQSSSLLSETSVFTTEAKNAIEEEIETFRRMEAARRKVLGLPPRELPSVADLIAKQRALVTLPE
ncbi:unnamed protein product [Phytomonas sp. Hart1]|nr:unnamed protein product [Phytomonas sp. Hart1]|eukprot:CCW69094.1 unnamed protein product [Phytomonas sp. isolate Hart1]